MPSAENLDEIMMSCCHPIWMIDDGWSVGRSPHVHTLCATKFEKDR